MTQVIQPSDAVRIFEEHFKGGGTIRVIRAPGRVNLIGEHTDYNGGLVLPIAIEPQVLIACRKREDGKVHLASAAPEFKGNDAVYSIREEIMPGAPKWANYCKGVTAELLKAGRKLSGMEAMIVNSLPVGSGLSSSAAILVGIGRAHLTLSGEDMDGQELALLCQRAENHYAGAPVGIMDQTIVANGRAGQAMMLDCRDLSKTFVPLNPQVARIVIANTMVRHELTGGEYGQRRKQCEAAVAYFQKSNPRVRFLRDVTMDQVASGKSVLGDETYRRARHVVGEIARTQDAAKFLQAGKFDEFGRLMQQSHASLRDDYQVSCDELDYLSDEAMKVSGVFGARMTGGGFGGCMVAAVKPDCAEALMAHLKRSYKDAYNIDAQVFATSATDGAQAIL